MDFFKDIKPLTKIGHNTTDQTTPVFDHKKEDIQEVVYKRQNTEFIPLEEIVPVGDGNQNLGHKGIWVFAIIAIIILFVVSSSRLSVAHVDISLKPKSVSVNETIQLVETKPGILPFETIEVTSEVKKEITFTKQEEKKEKAVGEITISNMYSTLPQTLVKQTRFETKDGLIYRLQDTITIPGYTERENEKVPGTITVKVIADAVGEKYNIGANTDFTIPGFKGSPQYTTISAKNIASFNNGLDGTYYVADSSVSTPNNDVALLESKLKELVEKQIPKEDFISLKGLYEIKTNQNGNFYSKEPTSTIVITGTLKQIVFPKKTFFSYLKSKYPDINTESRMDISSLDGVIVSSIPNEKSYAIQLSGVLKSYTEIDETIFKEKLAGKKENTFNTILAENFSENIENAELRIRPLWINTIPNAFNRIKIEYTDVK